MNGRWQIRTVGHVVVVEHRDDGLPHGERVAGAMLAAVRNLRGEQVIVLHDAVYLTSASHDYAQAFAGAFREMSDVSARHVAVIPRAVPRFFARVAMTLARIDIKIVAEYGTALGWIYTFDPESAAALEQECLAAAGG